MKFFLLFTAIFTYFLSTAQPPAGYYNTATGTGYSLKSQLHTIIKNSHNPQSYSQIWGLYSSTAFRDNYYENNGSLLDLYSEKPVGADSYEYTSTTQQCGSTSATREGFCYNREHIVPQSYFDEFQVEPMKSDPFHVFPSDAWVNSQRGNLPFGVVGTATYTSTNGSKKGSNSNTGYAFGFTGTVFEPINEFKGDVARAFFYFVTRYEDNLLNFYNSNTFTSCAAKYMFDGSLDKSFSQTFLNILYQWHIDDQVSAKEIAQNNAIFNHQGNRNPYIDNPQWVAAVWSAHLNTQNFTTDKISIYPNPVSDYLIIDSKFKINELTIYTSSRTLIFNVKNLFLDTHKINLETLSNGVYFIKINFQDEVIFKKIIVE